MGREPPSRPDQNGASAPRGDIDTFRPAAGEDGDAYSAETVVKAIPRELLADLAAALKAPGVPKGAPILADEPTPLGEDDATVIDRFDPADFEELPPIPSSGRGAPPPDLTPVPPPPDPEPLPVSQPLPAPALVAPAPVDHVQPVPLATPDTNDVDENTDFRAGTRWPWITAIVVVVISFAVTLAILKAI